ncbi:MAG: hypothetical protein SF053_17190 [Bacteroidia bacterium]|nr:hypothetical protein [Bacteroidia bacterium]
MNTHTDKSPDTILRTVAHGVGQSSGIRTPVWKITDNRASSIAQRQQQAQINRSPIVLQLKQLQDMANGIQPTPVPMIQLERKVEDVLNVIDQNKDKDMALAHVGGTQMRRIIYWNSQGFFDNDLSLKKLKDAMQKRVPGELDAPDDTKFPEWMNIRNDFDLDLPFYFGADKIRFRKRPEYVVFNGRGWISENVYWRSENKVRYMIHAILEWKTGAETGEPEPHITLRNAATQINIDLDRMVPIKDNPRIKGDLEATQNSYPRGLKGKREPGNAMKEDQAAFDHLTSEATKTWLESLAAKAQEALIG